MVKIMKPIAIMQGRLSPPQGERVQFFPTDWEEEFVLAKKMNFSGVTWFLDTNIKDFDPIAFWTDPSSLARIDQARQVLPIHSIACGLVPLFGAEKEKTIRDFRLLLPALAPRLHSRVICIALLLHTAPHTDLEKNESIETLQTLSDIALPLGLKIALESEMSAPELISFIQSARSPAVGVCYDVGSATAYGFDCAQEIHTLGNTIFEVHLKDHKKGHVIGKDASVQLSTGDTPFGDCFAALQQIEYRGGYTMQAWRGTEHLTNAKTQLESMQKNLQHIYGE